MDSSERVVIRQSLGERPVVRFSCQRCEHLAGFFGGKGGEANRVEKAKEGSSLSGETAIQTCCGSDDQDTWLGLQQVAKLLLAGVPQSVKNLVKILCEDQNWAILTAGMSSMRIEFGLGSLLIVEIRHNSL